MTELNEPFWEKIGVNIGEKHPETYLNSFLNGKSNVLTEELDYKTRRDFEQDFETSDKNGKKEMLINAFIEYNWSNKQTTLTYKKANIDNLDMNDLFEDLFIESYLIDRKKIVWIAEEDTTQRVENDEITYEDVQRPNVVVIREGNEDLKVRCTKNIIDTVENSLDTHLSKEESEPVDKGVLEKLSKVIEERKDYIKLLSVTFSETDLPNNSGMKIWNSSTSIQDIKKLRENDILSENGVSEIEKMKFRSIKNGKKFTVYINKEEKGFKFELSSNSGSALQNGFKESFEKDTNISLDTIYSYSSQDEKYLFNTILSGSDEAFSKYKDKLSDEAEEFILDVSEPEQYYVCPNSDCDTEEFTDQLFESMNTDPYCSECSTESEKTESFKISVNANSISTKIKNKFRNEYDLSERNNIQEWDVKRNIQTIESKDSTDRKCPVAEFYRIDKGEKERNQEFVKLNLVPIGGSGKPKRLNSYLSDALFFTYGSGEAQTYPHFGEISLYKFMFDGLTKDQIYREIRVSLTNKRDRIRQEAREARNSAEEYINNFEKDDDGNLQNKETLEEIYGNNGRTFEKHVFYLLKDLFTNAKRLGKEGKSESDGIVFCPKDTGSSYVFSYDAKRSHSDDGYEISQSEQDKVKRYLLESDGREIIRRETSEIRKEKDAHAIISQNIEPSEMEKLEEELRDTYSELTTKGIDNSGSIPHIILIRFEALVQLYEFYEYNWETLQKGQERGMFENTIYKELSTFEDYIIFDVESVEKIKEETIQNIQ